MKDEETHKLSSAKHNRDPSKSRIKSSKRINKQCNTKGSTKSLNWSSCVERMDIKTDDMIANLNLKIYNIFKIFPCARHVLMTFELWMLCARLWIFSLHISYFSPVISANIHCYVNYFDIQVLMMVTETKTLTSTLHHDIFTYLDYVFSATFI